MSLNFSNKEDLLSPVFARHLQTGEYSSFLNRLADDTGKVKIAAFSFPLKAFDPLACLELFGDKNRFRFYWEKPDDDFALSGGEELLQLNASGTNRFRKISRQIRDISSKTIEFSPVEHSHSGLFFLGGFSFFDHNGTRQWHPFGSGSFTIPGWLMVKEGNLGLLTITIDLSGSPTPETVDRKLKQRLQRFSALFELDTVDLGHVGGTQAISRNLQDPDRDRRQWIQSVEKARDYIREGHFEKIVLARETRVKMEKPLKPTLVLNRLRKKYPNCYSFLIGNKSGSSFIGSSPERLVKFRKNFMLTEALAGSIKRGTSATDDTVLEEKLLKSPKDLSEHNYVVTSIEQRLEPLVSKMEKGTSPVIKKLTNVQHLYTPITAWLKDNTDRLSILESLHPTPAVGGYPWHPASRFISQLEHFDRGWYAGPVGWLNNHNGGEFSVAIRSGLLENKEARFFAGCGIVAGSEPLREWDETNLKLMPMLSALQHE